MARVYRIPEYDRVTEIVKDFANGFAACDVVFGTVNMCHVAGDDKVTIMYSTPRAVNGEPDEFADNFISRYPRCAVLSQITLSLLHEIGHMVNKEAMTHYDANVSTSAEYFDLPNEKIATDWAGNFASKNLQFCLDFDTKLNSAILRAHMTFIARERMRIALDFASK